MSGQWRLTIIHSVPDYERWASALRESRSGGGTGHMTVFRSADDPNEVMVELELESLEDAKLLVGSPALRDFLDHAGIDIYPPVFIGERVEDLPT
jgi:hypothetical protein